MSHDLTHSIGLPKPPGYNLEWSCVTPIHHDLHSKLCRNPPRDPTLHLKLSGAPLASLGKTWFQTAWRYHTTLGAKRPSVLLSPIFAWRKIPCCRRHASPVVTAIVLDLYRLAARSTSPSVILVTQCYWFLALLNKFP